MAGLYYQPVALPAVGGASQTTQAASGVSTGLNSLGEKITGLGTRRQKRIDDELAKKEAMGLEILGTALEGAKDENEFNAILSEFNGSGIILPGQAEAIEAARINALANTGTRFDNTRKGYEATEAGHAATKAGYLAADAGIDSEIKENDFNVLRDFSPRINEVLSLYESNDPGAAGAAAALNAEITSAPNFKTDYAGYDSKKFFEETLGLQTLGSTTRTGLDTDETTRVTNATERFASVDGRRVTSATNDLAVTGANSARNNIIRDDQLGEESRAADALYAEWTRGNFTPAGLLGSIDTSNLSAEQKNRLSARVADNDFNITNPGPEFSDPNKTASYSQTPAQAAMTRVSNFLTGRNDPVYGDIKNLNPDVTIDSINDAAQRVVSANPSFKIYDRAKGLEAAGTYKDGFVGDIGVMLSKQLGDTYEISPGETVIIKNLQTKYNLSNEEMVALVESSVKEDDGPLGWWNKPEIRNKTLEKKAKAYDTDRDNMAAVMSTQQQAVSKANALATQIKLAQERAERAAQDDKPELAQKYAAEAAAAMAQLRGYDNLFENAESFATEDPAKVARAIKSTTAYERKHNSR